MSAAFLALLVSDQNCGVPQGAPSGDATRQIPAQMLAIYQQVGAHYGLPWQILAGIGQEECRHGLDADPSCAVIPGARGPGAANYAGASGPMQIGVGGAAGDEYDALAQYLPAAQRGLGPHDPTAAVELAALVLIKGKRAPTGMGIGAYLPYVRAYNGSGPAAEAYAARVLADAHRYSSGVTVLVAAVGCAAAQAAYVNPLARASGVRAARIDMGVDYSGRGVILSLANSMVTYATRSDRGWAYCGAAGALTLQLLNGPDRGRFVYITEGVVPTVAAGTTVSAGDPIATFAGAGCIEIGWAAGPTGSVPKAAALGQQAHGPGEDPGSHRTYCGNDMSALLASLGAPAGLAQGRPVIGTGC